MAAVVAGLLCGCSISSVSSTSGLPADGIVRKAVFENAKKDARILTFEGKSGDTPYVWFFDGTALSSPADQNLNVDITDAGSDLGKAVTSPNLIKLHFREQNLIQAKTTLKINFPKRWDTEKIRIYRKTANAVQFVAEAPANNGKTTSVLFPVDDTKSDLYLAAVNASFHEELFQPASSSSVSSQSSPKPRAFMESAVSIAFSSAHVIRMERIWIPFFIR
jgi:hypothetical protein